MNADWPLDTCSLDQAPIKLLGDALVCPSTSVYLFKLCSIIAWVNTEYLQPYPVTEYCSSLLLQYCISCFFRPILLLPTYTIIKIRKFFRPILLFHTVLLLFFANRPPYTFIPYCTIIRYFRVLHSAVSGSWTLPPSL